MNGIRPAFLSGKLLPHSYFEKPDPYKNAPSCNVNLLQLSRYAKTHNKAISEITADEIEQFVISK